MGRHNIQDILKTADFTSTAEMFTGPEGIVFGFGTTVGGGIEGWAPGAIYIDTDAAAGQQFWVNEGTKTTASFKRVEAGDTSLLDDEKIILGTGSDIRLYYNGTYMVAKGTGVWAAGEPPMMGHPETDSLAHYYFNDFVGLWDTNEWTIATVEAGGGDATEVIGDTAGGALTITNDGNDNDADQVTYVNETFKLATGKALWFECKATFSEATELDFALGLLGTAEDLTAVADNMLGDGVAFHKDDGDTNIDFVSSKDDAHDSVATVGTLDTSAHVYGFYFDGEASPSITPYLDGTAGTAVSTTICEDEELAPFVMIRNGDANARNVIVDYIKVVQIR